MVELIILVLAVYGLIWLPYSLKMMFICARIYETFRHRGYPKLDIKQLSQYTGYVHDDIVAACIADSRIERVMPGCYEAWHVPKQWRK